MTDGSLDYAIGEIERRISHIEDIRIGVPSNMLAAYRERAAELRTAEASKNPNIDTFVEQCRRELDVLFKDTFASPTALQIEAISRSLQRPTMLDYVKSCFDSFQEILGCGQNSIDPAIVAGSGELEGNRVMLIGHEKGHFERYRNGGSATPQGNKKALAAMRLAEEMNIPIITFIDTPGAWPLEDYLPAQTIANNIEEQGSIAVPHLSIVIGEGGSGGALALDVCDRRLMCQYAYYSVISVQGGAAIIAKDKSRITDKDREIAANCLRITAQDMKQLGIVDYVIKEPYGGARIHDKKYFGQVREKIVENMDYLVASATSSDFILSFSKAPQALPEWRKQSDTRWLLSPNQQKHLTDMRFRKYRQIGKFDVLKKGKYRKMISERMPEQDMSRKWISNPKDSEGLFDINAKVLYEEHRGVCPKSGYHYRLAAPEYIGLLVDGGTFTEFGERIASRNVLNFDGFERKLERARYETGLVSGLTTGYARIDGMEVIIAYSDFAFRGGTLGCAEGEKYARAVDYAIKGHVPLITINQSGGVRIQEGVLGLMQMAKTSLATARLKEKKIPYISIQIDPCMAGVLASYASLADLTVAEPNAQIGLAGLKVIEETVKQHLPKDYQDSERVLARGGLHKISGRMELRSTVADFLKCYVGRR